VLRTTATVVVVVIVAVIACEDIRLAPAAVEAIHMRAILLVEVMMRMMMVIRDENRTR
jgi:hypothetical protein